MYYALFLVFPTVTCCVCQHSIKALLTYLLTYLIQRRVCQIILHDRLYNDACTVLGLSSLHERRQGQYQKLFQQLACSTDNCLHYLLPCMHDPTITNSLRHANKYPPIFAKTAKFKNSFICYGLSHYQLTA